MIIFYLISCVSCILFSIYVYHVQRNIYYSKILIRNPVKATLVGKFQLVDI